MKTNWLKVFFLTSILLVYLSVMLTAQMVSNILIRDVHWSNYQELIYNPFLEEEKIAEIEFSIEPDSLAGSDFFFTISKGHSNSYPRKAEQNSQLLEYNLYNSQFSPDGLKELADSAISENVIILTQSPDPDTSTYLGKYYLGIKPGQMVLPGEYTDTGNILLYSGDLSNYQFLNAIEVKFTFKTNSICSATFATNELLLPMSKIEENDKLTNYLFIKSNDAYKIKLFIKIAKQEIDSENAVYLSEKYILNFERGTQDVGAPNKIIYDEPFEKLMLTATKYKSEIILKGIKAKKTNIYPKYIIYQISDK